jgi:hypothetical protein
MDFVEKTNVYKYSEYIRWAIFELACSSNIDHRNHSDTNTGESKIKEYCREYNNCEKAIERITKELVEDIEFNNNLDNYNVDVKENDDEELFDIKQELYSMFISYVGLYEIYNLHDDEFNNFQSKFFELI